MRQLTLGLGLAVIALLLSSPAVAQVVTPPHPNGCSVPGLPLWAAQGLDTIFLGACDQHDLCWAQCNGENPPFLGTGHKTSCDLQFLADMSAACLARSAQVALPLGDIDSIQEFIETCEGVAATFYAAVATPLTNAVFNTSQCLRGCNPNACTAVSLPLPATCGNGVGPGFCYLSANFNFCNFVNCNNIEPGDCQDAALQLCCPQCAC